MNISEYAISNKTVLIFKYAKFYIYFFFKYLFLDILKYAKRNLKAFDCECAIFC